MATAVKRKRKRSTKERNRKRSQVAEYRRTILLQATESLLNAQATGIEFPGGKHRESCRILLDQEDSVIATRRDNIDRARVEAKILHNLGSRGAPVPKLLATNHAHILIQQEILGSRLSYELNNSDSAHCERVLASTLSSLHAIHTAATESGLEQLVPTLGRNTSWIKGLLERPHVIGKYLKVPAPELPRRELINQLRIVEPLFIKWDSRPGNAIVTDQSEVFWFDWEHAGKRNRLDDMAWILGDEFVPDDADAEIRLLDEFIPKFSFPMDADVGHRYLMCYGCFHMVVRLGLILKHMRGSWWDLDYCIEQDKVGVTLLCAQRLAKRGARWAARCDLVEPLAPWFEKVSVKLESL